MEYFIYISKCSLLLAIFYLIYFIFLRDHSFFTIKRYYLGFGMFSAFLLPFLIFEQLREIRIPEQTAFTPATGSEFDLITSENIILTNTPLSVDGWQIVLFIYVIGVVIMGTRFVIQLFSVMKLIKSGEVIVKTTSCTYIHSKEDIMPFSFFLYIVYNKNTHTDKELELIIEHENVHASQWHSLDVILSQIILVLQWCNPIAWLYKKA